MNGPAVKPIGRPWLLASPAVLWLLVFGLAPLVFMVAMSFWKSTIFGTRPDFQLGNYARQLSEPLYGTLLLKSLRIAAASTLIALLVSYPIAYFLTRLRGVWKGVFIIGLFMPFWTSYVVRTFVWLPILGRAGAINAALLWLGVIDRPIDWLIYNEGTIYLGLVYVYTLFMVLPIYLSLDRIDPRLIEAAVDLGARPWSVFWRILLPLSWPGVLSGCIMVFLLGVGAYVTPRLLGGPSGIMYGNMIADQFLSNNNWAFGAALGCTLALVVVILLLVTGRWIGIRQVFTGGRF
jgi:spermidine/putrescine transport system permease protein